MLKEIFRQESVPAMLWLRPDTPPSSISENFAAVRGSDFCVLSIGADFHCMGAWVSAESWARQTARIIEEQGWASLDLETVAELVRKGADLERTEYNETRFRSEFGCDAPDINLYLVRNFCENQDEEETSEPNETQENIPEML